MTTQTYPTFSQQELVRAFAEEYPELKLRDDDFNNPQVVFTASYCCQSCFCWWRTEDHDSGINL